MPTPDENSADGCDPTPGAPIVGVSVGSALRTVSSLTLLSRLTGLTRDAVCSRLFGAGPVWSAFAFAFLLPNLFRRLFGEGALAAAFLPEYSRLTHHDADRARIYAGAVVRLLLLTLGSATVLGEIVLLGLLLTPLAATGGLAMRLSLLTLPFTPLVCATAVLSAMLQVRGRFAVPAVAPILVNVAIIAAATGASLGFDATPEQAILMVAAAVPLAGLAQVVLALATLGPARPRLGARLSAVRVEVSSTLRRMAPVAVGMSAMQINSLMDGVIASWPVLIGRGLPGWINGGVYPLDTGANATLFFAQRLYQFPLGVFGIALATAAFPALARGAGDTIAYGRTLHRSVRLSLFLGVPASVGLSLVASPLATVVYLGGAFDAEASQRVTRVLLGYAPGVWAFGLTHVLTRGFYARGDTRTPMRYALVSIVCNVVLSLSLIWWLREAALAWATTLCGIGQAAALMRAERTANGSGWAVGLPGSLGRTLIAALVMAGVALTMDRQLFSPEPSAVWGVEFRRLVVLVGVGAATFGGLSLLTNRAELRWLLGRERAEH